MADYMSREGLIERLGKNLAACNPGTFSEACYTDAIETVRNAPAADVAPVVHGRWEYRKIISGKLPMYVKCSACGIVSASYRSQWEGLLGAWKYCPNCGAKMDGGE